MINLYIFNTNKTSSTEDKKYINHILVQYHYQMGLRIMNNDSLGSPFGIQSNASTTIFKLKCYK